MDKKTKSLQLADGSFPVGTLLFYADNSLPDILIRLFSGSYWSHCAIAVIGNKRIEAWDGTGVRIEGGELLQLPNFAARTLPKDASPTTVAKAMTAIGKPYDIAGWGGNPLWNLFRVKLGGGPPDSFHCSSLIAWASGRDFKRPLRAVTPQDVFNWADAAQ